jgi:hypothetical protein
MGILQEFLVSPCQIHVVPYSPDRQSIRPAILMTFREAFCGRFVSLMLFAQEMLYWRGPASKQTAVETRLQSLLR